MTANRSYKVTRIEDIMHDLIWDLEERAFLTRTPLDSEIMREAAKEIERLNTIVSNLAKALEDVLSCNFDHYDGDTCGHYAQAKEVLAKAKGA